MPQIKSQTMFRLSPDAYAELERKVQPPFVQNETTVLQAGYQLGIQAVLKLLREGYVVGS